jgi:hypothetical protein
VCFTLVQCLKAKARQILEKGKSDKEIYLFVIVAGLVYFSKTFYNIGPGACTQNLYGGN